MEGQPQNFGAELGVSAPAPPRIRPLDGLRALAVGMVVGLHASLPGFTGGGYGVSIFFVLSGFLITGILTNKRSALSRAGLLRFYLRRFLRLFPALFVLVAFCALYAVVALDGSARHALLVECLTSITYVNDFFLGRGHKTPPFGYLGQTWSLGVEEQFYLLWPLVLMLLTRLVPTNRRRALCALVMAACFAAWRAHLDAEGLYAHLEVNIDGQADGLLIGCALALGFADVTRLVTRYQRRFSAAALGALCVLAALCVTHLNRTIPFELGYTVASLAGAVVITRLAIPADDGIGTRIVALFSLRPVVWLGVVSYGIYLWHPVVFDIAKKQLGIDTTATRLAFGPFLIGAVILIAGASHRFVELPFLRLKNRFEEPRAQAVPAPPARPEVTTANVSGGATPSA